ncbi:hypothetical protein HNQ56_004209 [Anaerotaenia torta]|uniref:hypothetical protein n=1 Tax=Anaerotaenia torta TaxID=433293 RepID=UPI003D1D9300
MAKCKVCKKNIEDGTEYCSDCQDQVSIKAKESYLDNLLNSVKNEPSVERLPRKKRSDDGAGSPSEAKGENAQILELDEDEWYRADFSDEFDTLDYEDDFQELAAEFSVSDEDLFGEDLSNLFSGNNQESEQQAAGIEAVATAEAVYMDEALTEQAGAGLNLQEEPAALEPDNELAEVPPAGWHEAAGEAKEDQEEPNSDNGIDFELDELLNRLDEQNTEPSETGEYGDLQEMAQQQEELQRIEQISPRQEPEQDEEEEKDDFLSLLGQMSEDDPVIEDIKAIHDMLENPDSVPQYAKSMPGDVGEVFSDALKGVSSLNDYDMGEEETPAKGKKEKKAKPKKEKPVKVKKTKAIKEAEEAGEVTAAAKPGGSLFQRLFGNVKDEKTALDHEKEQREESKPKKAQKKSPKKSKTGKRAGDDLEEEEGGGKLSKAERQREKAEKRKEKAEKKAAARNAIQVIDEIDEDPGRINRVGAALVLFFFAIIALIVVLGTNIITYTLSIEYATNYFNNRKYTQAYNEVYGVDIKDEDIEVYEKIMTVMYVNKQLNSYNNYCSMEKYPEALDSLLKGLARYDKYIELATLLGIESDMNYVRKQILAELKNVFHLTEKEALQILQYERMEDYSLAVYDVVLERMNN